MMFTSAPVETGLIKSLARPGGNITGTTAIAPMTAGKITEVLRDAVPRMSRITWICEPDYPGMPQYLAEIERACNVMKLRLTLLKVRSPPELEAALAAVAHEHPDGVVVSMTGIMLSSEARIIEFMAGARIPAMYTTPRPVRLGGLMCYSPDMNAIVERDAWMIDKILKGAKPSDIPVEEPSKFVLNVNLKTARAMGFTFPRELLARADEVFE
jgi:putative ABC transport system substrate-binding protein